MKLATKLVLIFMVGVLAIVGVFSWQTMQRHRMWLATQEQYAENLAEALAPGLEQAFRSGGEIQVQRTIELTTQYLRGPSLRWMDRRELPSQATRLLSRETVHLSVSGPDGNQQLSYIPLELEGHDGAVEVRQPDRASEDVQSAWRASLISVGAVALLSAAVILVGGVRLVGKPLHQLVTQVDEIGSGKLDQKVLLKSNDELGELSMAISKMAERLQSQRETIQRETESRLQAEQQLRHADRLTTIGTLAAGVAHELGTPLNVVAGRAALIAGQKLSPEDVVQSALAIKAESERMAGIIRQLMDFARSRPGNRQACDLCSLVQSTCGLMQPLAAQHDVKLDFQCLTQQPNLIADYSQLQQVILNLVSNAIQASPEGGRVDLVVNAETLSAAKEGQANQEYLRLVITDEGPGIPPENRERLFEPFFTTKDVGQGTGLGLSIAYGIVQEHGGWIDVRNGEQRGAVFCVYLPKALE